MNIALVILAVAAVFSTFFAWLAVEYRRTPIEEDEKDWQYINRMSPTSKDRIDQLLEDDKATRDRRPS